MDIYDTIVRPIVTEKSTHQARVPQGEGHGGAYTFEVHPDANKAQIKDAVEKIYRVKVLKVRTAVRQGKVRRVRMRYGKTRDTKHAVVVLDAQNHIDLF